MKMNGALNMVWAAALSAVVVIFIMLFTGISGTVGSNVEDTQTNTQRIVALEVQMEDIAILKADVKEILGIVNRMQGQ